MRSPPPHLHQASAIEIAQRGSASAACPVRLCGRSHESQVCEQSSRISSFPSDLLIPPVCLETMERPRHRKSDSPARTNVTSGRNLRRTAVPGSASRAAEEFSRTPDINGALQPNTRSPLYSQSFTTLVRRRQRLTRSARSTFGFPKRDFSSPDCLWPRSGSFVTTVSACPAQRPGTMVFIRHSDLGKPSLTRVACLIDRNALAPQSEMRTGADVAPSEVE